MFNKIKNPDTNRWVNINSKLGNTILKNYSEQIGGDIYTEINILIDTYNYYYERFKEINSLYGPDVKNYVETQFEIGNTPCTSTQDLPSESQQLKSLINLITNMNGNLQKIQSKINELTKKKTYITTEERYRTTEITRLIDNIRTDPDLSNLFCKMTDLYGMLNEFKYSERTLLSRRPLTFC